MSGGLDQIRQSPGTDERMVDGVGRIERPPQMLQAFGVVLVSDCSATANELDQGEHRGRA